MASTWSNAELRLMATGENDNTWGTQTNYNFLTTQLLTHKKQVVVKF